MFLWITWCSCNNKWILFYFVDQVWRTVIEDKDLAKHIENKDQSNYIWSRVDYLPLNLFSSPEPKFLNKHCHSHCFHMASSFLNLFLFFCNCLAISTFFLFILLGRFLKMTAWPCLFLRDSNYKVVHRVHLFWKSSFPEANVIKTYGFMFTTDIIWRKKKAKSCKSIEI